MIVQHIIASLIALMTTNAIAEDQANTERAIFAGGCFWCIEAELQEMQGVYSVTSGYTGGSSDNPSYKNLGDHAEAVEVVYDPKKTDYQTLLNAFWSNIDPTDAGGQFFDRGTQYRTVIYYLNDTQKKLAEASKEEKQAKLNKPIATTIEPASDFYPAESYHQDYYQTNPEHYNRYKTGSRRKEILNKVWNNNK